MAEDIKEKIYKFLKESKDKFNLKQISEKLNTTARSFLNGLFFFITVPIFFYKKIKKVWKWNPTGDL